MLLLLQSFPCFFIYLEIPNKLDTKETKKKQTKSEKNAPKAETRLSKVLVVDVRSAEEYPFVC